MSQHRNNLSIGTLSNPKMERINIIQEKLQYISQSKARSIKDQAYQIMQKRIMNIEKNINDNLREIEFKVREYRQTLKDSQRRYIENKSRFDLSNRIRKQQISQLQRKVYQFLMVQSEQRRQSQNKILKNFEEKYQQLALQLAKQIEKRKKYFNELDQDLTQTLPTLNIQSKQQLQQWKQKFEQLNNNITQQLENFRNQISNQSQKRQKGYEQLMEMINNVIFEIRKDLNQQKIVREKNKLQMIKLFQGTCQKLTQ